MCVYDPSVQAELLQFCRAQPALNVICFAASRARMQWLPLLKGANFLAQCSRNAVLGTVSIGKKVWLKCNLHAWLFAKQPEGIPAVAATAEPAMLKTV